MLGLYVSGHPLDGLAAALAEGHRNPVLPRRIRRRGGLASLHEDAVVLVAARIGIRDGRTSVLGDRVSVPDLTAPGHAPITLTLTAAACTAGAVRALREALQRHAGPTEVRIRLLGTNGPQLLAIAPPRFRVSSSPAPRGELKALFGPSCLTG